MRSLISMLPRAARHAFLLSKIRYDAQALAGVRVRLAQTADELLGAARLVHDAYVARGVLVPHETGLLLRRQSASPGILVFIATMGERVIGTMSVTLDSEDGLPLDGIFKSELDVLRARGEKIAELGSLAIDRSYRSSGLRLLLNRMVFQTTIPLGVDRTVLGLHPDAEDMYAASVLYERLGPARVCVYPGLESGGLTLAMTSPPMQTVEALYARHYGKMGPKAANAHWMYFASQQPQVEVPGAFNPASRESRRARRAVLLARPDIVARRASLVSNDEYESLSLRRAVGA